MIFRFAEGDAFDIDYLEGGETLEDFVEGFSTVSRESAIDALEEAKQLLLART